MNEKSLFSGERPLYSFRAAAKSVDGICSPCNSMATQHAPRVFFCVIAQAYLFFGLWFFIRSLCQIMVARAGQPSGWPVSIEAGTANPVRVTTHEICSSGGGVNRYSLEIVIMATVLTITRPKFTYIFAAVRRTDHATRPCMLRYAAEDERTARANFIRDYVLCFAGRVPVQAVAA